MKSISVLGLLVMATAIVHGETNVTPAAPATRLKELAAVAGVRDNQLIGYGLVVGLNGTGDRRQTVFSAQTLGNLLEKMGVAVNPSVIQVRNTAAVMVTASLPPFAQTGTKIDVSVAAVGDSSNLQGGLLLMTPLKASDGQVYAVGQGSVVTGGFGAGRGGNSQTVNHPTVGRVPEGALVEKSPPSVKPSAEFTLQLRRPDFTTAARIVETINKNFGDATLQVAEAMDSGSVRVKAPAKMANRPVEFIAAIEGLMVDSDTRARVVINERTGTIVVGSKLRIAPTSILHGALTVEVQTRYEVSQPEMLSGGKTQVVPEKTVKAQEEKAKNIQLKDGATVEDLVKALMAIGATPRDIIAILQSLRSAGAMEAEIEVI